MMRDVIGLKKSDKDPIYLRLIDRFSFIYERLGINYPQMRSILAIKMMIDGRKDTPMPGMESGKKSDEEKNHFFSSLWVYTLISVFLLFLFVYDNWVFQYTLYFSFLFIMTLSTLIANFSGILLDTKDATLIGTKPVDRKTLGAAKSTHVGIYLVAFTLAIGLPVILFTFYFNGIVAGLLVLFLSFLASLWCLGLAQFVYATILKRFDGERLKNIIAYSQISLSIFMVIGYYIMGQIFQIVDPENLLVEINLSIGHGLLFPLWFVAPFGMLQEGWSTTYGLYSFLLIAGTILLALVYNRNSDRIESNLQKMDASSVQQSRRGYIERVSARLLCFKPMEAAYYHFGWQLTKTEREFKTRLYPSIASALVFPLVMTFNNLTGSQPGMEISPVQFLYLPYFTLFLVPVLAVSIQFSNHYKGSWVFSITPGQSRAPFLRAVTKAMLVKILLPLYGVLAVMVLFFTDLSYSLQMINGLLLVSLILYFETKRSVKAMPFTRKYSASDANLGCMGTVIFLIPVILVSIVMIASQLFIPFADWGLLFLLTGLNIWWMRSGFENKEDKIKAK